MSKPAGRLVFKPASGGDSIAVGTLWPVPFPTDTPMYNLSLGNRDEKYGPPKDKVLELLSGEGFINVYINEEDDL